MLLYFAHGLSVLVIQLAFTAHGGRSRQLEIIEVGICCIQSEEDMQGEPWMRLALARLWEPWKQLFGELAFSSDAKRHSPLTSSCPARSTRNGIVTLKRQHFIDIGFQRE